MSIELNGLPKPSPLEEALAAGSSNLSIADPQMPGITPAQPTPEEGVPGVEGVEKIPQVASDGITPRGQEVDAMLESVAPVDGATDSEALDAHHTGESAVNEVHGTEVPQGGVHRDDDKATLDLGHDPLAAEGADGLGSKATTPRWEQVDEDTLQLRDKDGNVLDETDIEVETVHETDASDDVAAQSTNDDRATERANELADWLLNAVQNGELNTTSGQQTFQDRVQEMAQEFGGT
ncbi:MAG: hypothetical protein AAF772_15155 [Acidobacteriota bacterium]